MSKSTKTVSVTLPLWVVEFYDRHQWEVEVARPKLMRGVLSGYAKAKISERAEEAHPSPGPFEDSDSEES